MAATVIDVLQHHQSGPHFPSRLLGESWDFVSGPRLSESFVESGGRGHFGLEERERDPWSSSRNWPRHQAQNYMSKEFSAAESSAQRVASSQEPSTAAPTTSTYNYGSSAVSLSPGTSAQSGNVPRSDIAVTDSTGYYRPQIPSSASTSGPRPLGVQSILNPTQSEHENGRQSLNDPRGRQTTTNDDQDAPPLHSAPATSPKSRKRNQRNLRTDEPSNSPQSFGPRRTLTPASPARRAESLGVRRSLISLSSITQPVSLAPAGGRFYTAEPGTRPEADIPPLPASFFMRGQAQDPQPGEASSGSARNYGGGPALATEPGSHTRKSESPGTSQSSYSYVSQSSPLFTHGRTAVPQQGFSSVPITASQLTQGFTTSHYLEGHRHQAPGQTSLQMTLNTEQGTMLVPVDIQQASKTANEKRKRNASASARFRARRKEKEKEASHTIVNLETEVREAMEERDHYRNERDYFRDLASRYTDLSQLPPRPSSPALRRDAPLLPPISVESPQYQDQYRDPSEPSGRAPMRRRTGDQTRHSESSMSESPMLPPQIPFPSQLPAQPLSLPPVPLPPSLPNPFLEGRPGQSTASPSSFPPLSRSQSHDPFRPAERYDRSWDPSRP